MSLSGLVSVPCISKRTSSWTPTWYRSALVLKRVLTPSRAESGCTVLQLNDRCVSSLPSLRLHLALSLKPVSWASPTVRCSAFRRPGRARVPAPSSLPFMHPKRVNLSQTELFQRHDHFMSWDECVRLSYARAKAIGKLHVA